MSFNPSSLLQLDRTPLQWACAKGNTTIVELLIDAGADLEAKDKVILINFFHLMGTCVFNIGMEQGLRDSRYVSPAFILSILADT